MRKELTLEELRERNPDWTITRDPEGVKAVRPGWWPIRVGTLEEVNSVLGLYF